MKKIKVDDTVKIISGDDRGKTGKVLKVFTDSHRVVVEGVNMMKRHTRPSAKMQQGGILEIEAPIHASNVKLIAPKSNVATRVGTKILKNGSKVRVAKHPDAAKEEIE